MLGWLFTHLIVVVGTVAGLFNPFIGIIAYYLLAILRPQELWFWSFDRSDPTRLSLIVAFATLIGWVVHGRVFDLFKMRGIRLVMLCYAFYVGIGVLSWKLWAISPNVAWDHLQLQLKIFLMGLVTITTVRTAKQIKIFASVILGCLGYIAWVYNQHWIFEGAGRFGMMGGVHGDNNNLALTMVIGVPLAAFMALWVQPFWAKALCVLAALLQIHVVLFAFSRGGMLGLIVVGLVIVGFSFWRLPRKGLMAMLLIVMLAGTYRLAGEPVRERFATILLSNEERDASARSRLELWAAAWESIKEKPLGWGPACFPLVMERYGFPKGKLVHSVYLQTGADYGVIGMVGFSLFYLGALYKSYRLTRQPTDQSLIWTTHIGMMVFVSLLGYMVCATFLSISRVEVSFIVACLGLCTIAHVKEAQAKATEAVETVDADLHDSGFLAPGAEPALN